jgi:selenide,water dikinase
MLKNTKLSPALTSLSHGGGCGCKIAPGILADLLATLPAAQPFKQLMVGIETADDAAVYRLNDSQALIATTDFFMPIVDDPFDFGRIAATNFGCEQASVVGLVTGAFQGSLSQGALLCLR